MADVNHTTDPSRSRRASGWSPRLTRQPPIRFASSRAASSAVDKVIGSPRRHPGPSSEAYVTLYRSLMRPRRHAVNPTRTLDRRTFVVDLGRGSLALAVLGIAGCAPAATGSAAPSRSLAASGGGSPDASASASAEATASAPRAGAPRPAPHRPGPGVNLGFVSAYILVHGGEAAIVDTGVEGSGDAIAAALTGIGLDWPAVAHVILTHNHGDHAGSAADVLDRAADATGYAGAEDIAGITVPRALTPVQDGDTVFDSRSITAPGHTAGSIAVLDPAAGGSSSWATRWAPAAARRRSRAPSSPRTWTRRRRRS